MNKKISLPRILLHLEGFCVFIASIMIFNYINGNWKMFILLILFPDLGMLGYLINKRIGSITYNIMHTYILPFILVIISLVYNLTNLTISIVLFQISIIWFSHIGIDRMLGFGLKYKTSFKDNHLNRL